MMVNEIRTTILRELYRYEFSDDGERNLNVVLENGGWDGTEFWNVADRLTHDGLIKAWTMGGNFLITEYGILHAEEEGIPPAELVSKNRRIRTVTLNHLATAHDERGSLADVHYSAICEATGFSEREVVDNLEVLSRLDYVESIAAGSYKITYEGLDAVEEWRSKVSLGEEFEALREMKPQARGRAFQKLFAKGIQQQGWTSEEGLRTDHEEMDVIFSKGREYFFVECKWLKKPIEAATVREIHGKVSNRVDVRALIASMSGFSKGAKQQAEDYANEKVILFFGPGDISSFLEESRPFEEILDEKYRMLVTRKQISYD